MLCVCKQYLFSSTVQLNELSDLYPRFGVCRWHVLDQWLNGWAGGDATGFGWELQWDGPYHQHTKDKDHGKGSGPEAATRQVQLQLADEPVDVVEEFEYLGNIVMSNCELDREISVRIRKPSSSGACAGSCGTNRRLRWVQRWGCSRLPFCQLCCMVVRHGPHWQSRWRGVYESYWECQWEKSG